MYGTAEISQVLLNCVFAIAPSRLDLASFQLRRSAKDSVEVLIRFKPSEPEVHEYTIQLRPRADRALTSFHGHFKNTSTTASTTM